MTSAFRNAVRRERSSMMVIMEWWVEGRRVRQVRDIWALRRGRSMETG